MVKRAHEGRNNQFFFQNIKNEIFKIFNMKKQHEIHQNSLLNQIKN